MEAFDELADNHVEFDELLGASVARRHSQKRCTA
jgi:hypothetical protein